MCYYRWDKKSENYKMYPLITYTSYISEITCISYTPDCHTGQTDAGQSDPYVPLCFPGDTIK